MTQTKEPFEMWALVELMGHQRVVGKITEQSIAGAAMLRVDIPGEDGHPRHTRFYSSAAIYAINPMGEAEAKAMAAQMSQEPVYAYTLKQLQDAASPGGGAHSDYDQD